VAGGQAEMLRVVNADYNAMKIHTDFEDERYLFLSDILPTAWQGVMYANLTPGDTVLILGLGPVGQFASRIARYRGHRVIGVDPVVERRALAERYGVETIDLTDDALQVILDMTDGRGPNSVIDAVGMEAHGSPVAAFAQNATGILPKRVGQAMTKTVGIDRLAALMLAIDAVQRGGTISISGVYGGVADPLPMMTLFDKQIRLSMGQCNVHRWIPGLWHLAEDPSDPLGVTDLVTHHAPLSDAPRMYELFKQKQDGCIKVVLNP
jgi:threonine dehydrogenase-like Zn-dependent dehydrogenase